jgi:hypothetical protein
MLGLGAHRISYRDACSDAFALWVGSKPSFVRTQSSYPTYSPNELKYSIQECRWLLLESSPSASTFKVLVIIHVILVIFRTPVFRIN